MADEAMNTEMQDANASKEPQQETETDTAAQSQSGTTEQGSEASATNDSTDNANTDETNEGAEEVPFLVARYNKADVSLTKEKAKELAEKGMHYESKLDYLATIKGTTINEMLKKAIDDIDNAERSRLEEQFGDDTEMIDKCMKIFHDEQRAKYEKAIADRKLAEDENEKSRIEQIGEEFIELKKSFPELKTIDDVPKAVLKDASKISLEHAYLKHLHRENQNKQAVIAKQQEAESKSTGSMSSDNNSSDSVRDNFIKGIWSR